MWEKFRRGAYSILGIYVFIAVISGALAFQFITLSLYFGKPVFQVFIVRETYIITIAALVGIFSGALVYLMFFLQGNNQITKEKNVLYKVKTQSRILFYLRYFVLFGLGGSAALLARNILGLNGAENFLQVIFSRMNIIDYVGIFVSGGIFGFIFSIGLKKRLKKVYLLK